MPAGRFVHLHVHSVFSFQDSVCPLDRLVARVAELGMGAVAVTDHDGMYGAVRFYRAAREAGVKPILGAEVTTEGGHHLTLLAETQRGYGNICRMATAGHFRVLREMTKGGASAQQLRKEPRCPLSVVAKCADGVVALSGCRRGEVPAAVRRGDMQTARKAVRRFQEVFGQDRFFVELCLEEPGHRDRAVIARLAALAEEMDAPIVATNNVHYLTPDEAPVHDLLACMQTLTTRREWHASRRRGAVRYLKSPREMMEEFSAYPEAIANTVQIAEMCKVELGIGELHFPHFRMREYQGEGKPAWWPREGAEVEGKPAEQLLEWLCWEGAEKRYDASAEHLRSSPTSPVSARLRHELNIIRGLGLCEYFLVVWDMVEEARARGIRCSGRGSAADSLVAYVLGITQVDPLAARLLFERFLNPERRGMPDIDIDFDSRRRDEMIEYVARRYGPDHTAMVATVNTFHARSAIREVGKALEVPERLLNHLCRLMPHIGAGKIRESIAKLPELRGSGFDAVALKELLDICEAIDGFPRHLSVHLGGVVISRDPITDFTPLEVSAKGVIVCQFDKDDIEALGLVKMDMLGLRILAAVEEARHIIQETRGKEVDLHALPLDDPKTYELLRSTKTIGLFQLESPGMRGLLSGLQPTHFEDIIANISLFRPGPMQADMIGPFLARRHGKEEVTYLHPSVRPALEETYGVILYQEQVLEVASALAGLTFGQSDTLRRAMTHHRSPEEMEKVREVFMEGCLRRGVEGEAAEEAFRRLSAFAAYGFCKAHAASFAIIAYETAYLKAHYPAEFLAGILSNQPMGFYPPEVIVNEAKHCGVKLLPVDINRSRDRYWVEEGAIRVGLAQVRGLSAAGLRSIFAAREAGGPFSSLREFCARTGLARPMVANLIRAGAFAAMRPARELLWELNEIGATGARRRDRRQTAKGQLALPTAETKGATVRLPAMTTREQAASELATMGVSLQRHPLYFARERLHALGVRSCRQLEALPDGKWVRVAGIVIARQRPPIKSGQTIVFITLEDETGLIEVTVFERVYKRWGKTIFSSNILVIDGVLQKKGRYGTVVLGRRFQGLRV
ncbi:MAG: DNA polymerase III subunit alpha [Armatimonadetes bacterium]|nr:DNA polymerase III subunit alpha [Armatimonadota bacterium]